MVYRAFVTSLGFKITLASVTENLNVSFIVTLTPICIQADPLDRGFMLQKLTYHPHYRAKKCATARYYRRNLRKKLISGVLGAVNIRAFVASLGFKITLAFVTENLNVSFFVTLIPISI